jgi:predicted PurR-regulated permease PerM
MTHRTFSHFIAGQCLEACIIFGLFIITLNIFDIPYALLISIIIAVLSLIPIVGSFTGCAIGALLILIANPVKAIVFVVLFIVVIQIEANVIYPHVVGNQVGLPGIWVLASVTIGGNLFGIVGMLVFIPLVSVLYSLFRTFIYKRLNAKNITIKTVQPWEIEDDDDMDYDPAEKYKKAVMIESKTDNKKKK